MPVPPASSFDANTADLADIASCRSGSIDSFAPIVQRHSPRIIRLCYHFLGDWEEARDLAQETFARAFHALDRYDTHRPFGAWITTIAARLATDRLRRRRMIRRGLAAERRQTEPSTGPSQEAALSLREALAHLTPRQRQSVVLCDLHGMSASEAAGLIGCTASTVRVLRFLARRRLRADLTSSESGAQKGAGSELSGEPLIVERGE